MVLALLGVLIAPFFIDWSAYRADFEREAGRILGQRVVVRGDASARLLPFPSVTFSDIEVEGNPGDRPVMTASHFRMDAELAPYLSGELKIFSMRIEDPVLDIRLGADGRATFLPKGGALPTKAAVVLDKVTVDDGSIRVSDAASSRQYELTKINGIFAAQSLLGPVSGGGTLEAEGRPLGFQLSAGSLGKDGRLPTRLTLEDADLELSTVLDGRLSLIDGTPRFEGAIRSASAIPQREDGKTKAARPAAEPKLPRFVATGTLAAGTRAFDVTNLRLSVGEGQKPYVLTGSASLSAGAAPFFSLALDGEQIDIDALANGGEPSVATTFERRLEAARQLLGQVPQPPFPGSVRLTLPVVAAGDTTIRDLSVEASPIGRDWTVQRFSAELPGRTRMEAAGLLHVEGQPRFRGTLLVAARQPSGFSEWLTGAVDPAVRTLAGAGFSATVELSPARQSFRDLELDIGGDQLRGTLVRSGERGDRAVDASLEGGRLDLDALVALSRLFTGEADAVADARRGSLKLAAGPVAYGGTTAERVDADLAFDGQTLTIARGDVRGLAGSDITAKGTLTGFDADLAGSIDATLVSGEPSELVGFLSQKLPASPTLDVLQRQASTLGPLKVSGTIHTTPGEGGERPTLNVDLAGHAAQTEVALKTVLGNGIYAGGEAGRFGADLRLSSADPAELLGQFGVEALPVGTPAPLSLALSVSAGTVGPVAVSAALRAPGSELTAEGALNVSATGFESGELALSGRSDDAAPWLLATGTSFGAGGLDALPASLGGTLAFDGTKTQLQNFEGSLGAVDVSAELERQAEGPVTGTAFFSQLSVPWLATLAYGRPTGDAAGSWAWSKANFGASLLPALRFALDVTADRLELGGDAAAGEAFAHIETSPSEVSLTDMRGTFGGGYATGSLQFRNEGGFGAFAASADLQGLDLGTLSTVGFALPGEEDAAEPGPPAAISGILDARLRLDGSGQSYAGLLSAMTGAGRLHVENAAFRGTKPGLLPEALAAADGKRVEPTLPGVSRFLGEATGGASYPVPDAAADFSIIGGVARLAAVTVERPGETLNVEGGLRLVDIGLSGSIRLDLDPGDEAIEGAAPSVQYALGGTLPSPKLTPDVQALANYLSVRALEREQARVEAIQASLQEKLRLRREARLYRWREASRLAAEEAAATAERLRIERNRREEQAKRDDERRAAIEAAEAEAAERRAEKTRVEKERAEREAARVAAAAERARTERAERARSTIRPESPAPALDFDPVPAAPVAPPPPAGDPNLPGVGNPLRF